MSTQFTTTSTIPATSTNTLEKSFYRRRLPQPPAIALSSTEGKAVFAAALASGFMEGYFPLAEQFRTQEDPAFCGLSSLTMVLNALGKDPGRVWKGPWRWFSEDMLDCCVPIDVIKKTGINFHQLQCLARCNGAQTQAFFAQADNVNVDMFREHVKAATSSGMQHIVVSYSRKQFSQTGDGHFSPIGGYEPQQDLCLILDVARFKYPPHWVPLSLLFESMKQIDSSTSLSRGFILLKNNGLSSIYFVLSQRNTNDWQAFFDMSSSGYLNSVIRSFRHDCCLDDVESVNKSTCNCCRMLQPDAKKLVELLSTYIREFSLNYVPDDVKKNVDLLLTQLRASNEFRRVQRCKVTADFADRELGLEIITIMLLTLTRYSQDGKHSDSVKYDELPDPLRTEVQAVSSQIKSTLDFCRGECAFVLTADSICEHCDNL